MPHEISFPVALDEPVRHKQTGITGHVASLLASRDGSLSVGFEYVAAGELRFAWVDADLLLPMLTKDEANHA